jgi:hypothetical protein
MEENQHTLPRISYLGIFDDEIPRRDPHWQIGKTFFNRTLINAALYGPELLINDGFLLHYDAGRRALMSRKESPLIALNEVGFAKIHARNGKNLHEMPKRMADLGVKSYVDIVSSGDWSNLERHLMAFARSPLYSFEDWPKEDAGHGFVRLIRQVSGKTPGQLGLPPGVSNSQSQEVFHHFFSMMDIDPDQPPRNAWSQIVSSPDRKLDTPAQQGFFRIANEAYHHNFAACLLGAKKDQEVSVITQYSTAFEDIQTEILEATNEQLFIGGIPVPRVPENLLELENWDALREVVDRGSVVGAAKINYLVALERALQDPKLMYELRKACDEYSGELRKCFGSHMRWGGKASALLNLITTSGTAGVGTVVSSLTEPALVPAVAGSAIVAGLACQITANIPWVFKRFKIRNASFFEDYSPRRYDAQFGDIIRRRLGASHVQIDRKFALEHVAALPTYNNPF